jgi:hypothetical protein
LIIDPVTDTADATTITGLFGVDKWSAGVLAPSGRIFGVPRDSTGVLIIDPVTDTADTDTITGLFGTGKWVGGTLAPNGKIYCMPRDATSVLIIDPLANGSYPTNLLLSGYLNSF